MGKHDEGEQQHLFGRRVRNSRSPGVTAAQTLSRLNRTHRTAGGEQKAKTFVIDFINKPEDIKTAFEPYFTNATLETETDPYVVVHLARIRADVLTDQRELAGSKPARC